MLQLIKHIVSCPNHTNCFGEENGTNTKTIVFFNSIYLFDFTKPDVSNMFNNFYIVYVNKRFQFDFQECYIYFVRFVYTETTILIVNKLHFYGNNFLYRKNELNIQTK